MLTSNLINRLCASPCACGISSHMKVKPFPHGGVKNERPMLSSPVQPDTIQSRFLLLISCNALCEVPWQRKSGLAIQDYLLWLVEVSSTSIEFINIVKCVKVHEKSVPQVLWFTVYTYSGNLATWLSVFSPLSLRYNLLSWWGIVCGAYMSCFGSPIYIISISNCKETTNRSLSCVDGLNLCTV